MLEVWVYSVDSYLFFPFIIFLSRFSVKNISFFSIYLFVIIFSFNPPKFWVNIFLHVNLKRFRILCICQYKQYVREQSLTQASISRYIRNIIKALHTEPLQPIPFPWRQSLLFTGIKSSLASSASIRLTPYFRVSSLLCKLKTCIKIIFRYNKSLYMT